TRNGCSDPTLSCYKRVISTRKQGFTSAARKHIIASAMTSLEKHGNWCCEQARACSPPPTQSARWGQSPCLSWRREGAERGRRRRRACCNVLTQPYIKLND